MSFTKFPNELFVLLNSDKQDLGSRILIMLRILHRCGFDGEGVCFETRETIAEAVGLSNKTVSRVMKTLEKDELIHIHRTHRNPNHVTLTHKVKKLLEGQRARLNRYNTILYGRAKSPSNDHQKEEQTMGDESAKRPRKKKKPSTAVKKKRVIKYVSELDRIHEEYLQSLKGKPEEGDGS